MSRFAPGCWRLRLRWQTTCRSGASVEALMGSSTDALKLVSSLTLFGHAAKLLHAADGLAAYGTLARVAADVLNAAARQGYGPCQYTISRLGSSAPEEPRCVIRVSFETRCETLRSAWHLTSRA